MFSSNCSYVTFLFVISYFFVITSLSSFKLKNIFFNFIINIEGLNDLPSLSVDAYDKYSCSSAVVNALYILKFSSYKFSIVPFASSIPFNFKISLSESLKNPSSLLLLGNTPSFIPIIKITFTF